MVCLLDTSVENFNNGIGLLGIWRRRAQKLGHCLFRDNFVLIVTRPLFVLIILVMTRVCYFLMSQSHALKLGHCQFLDNLVIDFPVD